MTQQQQQYGPSEDDSTTPDEWAALADGNAATWRGLDALTANMAAKIRQARAAVLAGKVDASAVGDPDELARKGRRALDMLTQAGPSTEATAATLGDLAALYWQRIAEQREAAPTGLAGLDKALGGGLQPGRLMVLLGAPGKGKTTLANQIAEHIASGGRPVVYLTMEDPAWALLAKTLARLGSLDYAGVLQGRASMRPAINAALAELATRRSASRLLYIEQPGRLSLAELQERAAAHFAKYGSENGGGPGLVVVDYLQRAARASMPNSVQSELRLAVSALTDQLRDLGRELDCTVLALGSQNRAGYGNGASALASAKESGDIEYGCDVLAAIGEDEKRSTTASFIKPWQLNIAKNRQGETRPLDLDWYPDRQQFTMAGEAAK
ncbi:MAG: AAA family ATPase [Ktedonobacterales bacterium]|nr:AAA family ATPase [Ktedonobacterales bacterium]